MVVMSKKRIQIILSCLLVGLFAFSFQIAGQKKEEQTPINKNSVVETTATPVSGKTVVLDAGHGIPDERSPK